MDADGSHDPREIPRYVNALLQGADFVKGSRFAPGGGTTDMPRYRQAGNGAFVLLTNLLFSATFTDLCYGYHAFWKYCLDAIDLEDVNGFEIDTALYLGALRQRLRISEVPSFEGYRFNGQGKLKTIPDGLRVLMTITRQSLKKMKNTSQENYLGFRGMNSGYLPLPADTHTRSTPAGYSHTAIPPAGNQRTGSEAARNPRPAKEIPASERSPMATVINPLYEKKNPANPTSSSATAGDQSLVRDQSLVGDQSLVRDQSLVGDQSRVEEQSPPGDRRLAGDRRQVSNRRQMSNPQPSGNPKTDE
jgi:hypothetical protein